MKFSLNIVKYIHPMGVYVLRKRILVCLKRKKLYIFTMIIDKKYILTYVMSDFM